MRQQKPAWLTKRIGVKETIEDTVRSVQNSSLHTVCEEACCPNLVECYAQKTATFLLLGKSCTRSCAFCEIAHEAHPLPLDPNEPKRVCEAICSLKLQYVVLTMVTRDDLPDGGASHVAETVQAIRQADSSIQVEVLVSDFDGKEKAIQTILESGIAVFNHNIETVERLTPRVRHKATYRRSLQVLKQAHQMKPNLKIKSGLMVGLGEQEEEVYQAFHDLLQSHVELVTIGQYLRPSSKKMAVYEYVTPQQFQKYKEYGESIGIKEVLAGPFVRSSYHARTLFSCV